MLKLAETICPGLHDSLRRLCASVEYLRAIRKQADWTAMAGLAKLGV